MGAAAAGPALLEAAHQLGALLARAGFVVLTGGRPAGIMDAALAGAKTVPGSLTIGIVPGTRESEVSRHADLVVFTGMGDARNSINVLSSTVVVACGVESPGTASEVALAIKAGRPVILLAPSPSASRFFGEIAAAGRLHEAATPDDVLKVIGTLEVRNAG
jgi:uncharacterized protein (TIGR00725 family)